MPPPQTNIWRNTVPILDLVKLRSPDYLGGEEISGEWRTELNTPQGMSRPVNLGATLAPGAQPMDIWKAVDHSKRKQNYVTERYFAELPDGTMLPYWSRIRSDAKPEGIRIVHAPPLKTAIEYLTSHLVEIKSAINEATFGNGTYRDLPYVTDHFIPEIFDRAEMEIMLQMLSASHFSETTLNSMIRRFWGETVEVTSIREFVEMLYPHPTSSDPIMAKSFVGRKITRSDVATQYAPNGVTYIDPEPATIAFPEVTIYNHHAAMLLYSMIMYRVETDMVFDCEEVQGSAPLYPARILVSGNRYAHLIKDRVSSPKKWHALMRVAAQCVVDVAPDFDITMPDRIERGYYLRVKFTSHNELTITCKSSSDPSVKPFMVIHVSGAYASLCAPSAVIDVIN
jgi:hypothetical protein